MSQITLYELLPAIYRIRDAEQDGQLRAFLEILQQELRLLEADIEHLYDNWFIETCDGWVVPYIGDLLAVSDLNEATAHRDRQERRTYVANTLAYRQRKGSTAILEQIGRDITGWGVRAVEAQSFVATTQHLSHLRPQSSTVNLRQQSQQNTIPIPFRTTGAFTPEIRSNPQQRGSYTPNGVALYLWRLQSYAIERGTPRAVPGLSAAPQGRYFTLNPLGYDAPLFNNPQTETDITELAQEVHIPGELSPSLWESEAVEEADRPVQIYFDGTPLKRAEIHLADLADWQTKDHDSQAKVALDLQRGRMAVLTEDPPQNVTVNYSYGFSDDVGGGPYSRTGNTVLESLDASTYLVWKVRSPHASPSLPQAIREWNQFARHWQACYDLISIPLSYVACRDDGSISILAGSGFTTDATSPLPSPSRLRLFPPFHPGIVSGLNVFAECGDLEAQVTAGSGIDASGNLLTLGHSRRIYLGRYRSQAVMLILSPAEHDPTCLHIDVLPATASPDRPYFVLARLELNSSGQVQRLDNAVRQGFQPGVLSGLAVAVNQQEALITVSPGLAVNARGEAIALPSGGTLSLAADRNQVFFLFLQPAQGEQPPTLGMIRDAAGGLIELQSNQTYSGDLFLRIPAAQPLYLVAADGDRPHLLGHLTLRGTASPATEDGGEFTLEGLLLEGNLTVRPGNLQRLAIAHSTLVPGHTLRVERAELPITNAQPDDVTFLALLMYSLTLLQRMLRVGLTANNLPLQVRLGRITEIWGEQCSTLLEGLHRFLSRWAPPPPLPTDEDEDDAPLDPRCYPDPPVIDLGADNSRLHLSLVRSISGAIALADSVPHLSLTDSILDSPLPPSSSLPIPPALTAPGTDADITTSTILGASLVRTLEASNSLFTDKVTTQRQQIGCLRFCFVPQGSRTPPRYRCQPDLTLIEQIGTLPVAITSLTSNPITQQTWVGTAGQGSHRLIAASQTWAPVPTGLPNAAVTALLAFSLPGMGTISPAAASDPIGTINGTHTRFLEELQVGDAIAVQGQVRTIQAIPSNTQLQLDQPLTDLPPQSAFQTVAVLAGTTGGALYRVTHLLMEGSGQVSTTQPTAGGAIVVGCGTKFTPADVGKTLIVEGDRRTITQVRSGLELEVNAPFAQSFAGKEFLLLHNTQTTPGQGRLSTSRDRTTLTGCNTRFLQQLSPGDEILLAGQSRTVIAITADNLLQVSPAFDQDAIATAFRIRRTCWEPVPQPRIPNSENRRNTDITALALQQRLGTGRATTKGTTVTGQGTLFAVELAVGECLTIAGQTRRITAIAPDNGSLTVAEPFSPDITTPTPFQTSVLWMGTAGNGVFRSSNGGQTWQAMNEGLTNRDVRAIATDPHSGDCFVGTWGGGVFRSSDNGNTWRGGDPSDVNICQTGLTHPYITGLCLSATTRHLFAATLGGGVFRSTDGGLRWEPARAGLTNPNITAIVGETVPGKGAIASDYTSVRGNSTDFQREFAPGDSLTAAGQTRRIMTISTADELRIDQPFDPDLPPNTPYQRTTLYVGSTGGSIFRSSSNGCSWQVAGSGLTQTDITCLVLSSPVNGKASLLAGTRIGSLFISQNSGKTWATLNTGLNRVDDMLLLLNQMQPRFTDERYGQPGYAQLSSATVTTVRTGAENGSEMGVFNSLKFPQREDNLKASLNEYLRFGITPDLIYVT